MRTAKSLSVALAANHDPADRKMSSGWTASVLEALGDLVDRVVPVNCEPPQPARRLAMVAGILPELRPHDLRHLRTDPKAAGELPSVPFKWNERLSNIGVAAAPMRALRQRVAYRRLAAAGTLDGVIQHGGEWPSPPGVRMVTSQDSTLLQALRSYPWPYLRDLSRRQVDHWLRRQRVAYDSAVACCVTSHWVADSLRDDYGVPAEKIHVIGLGANHVVDGHSSERDWSHPHFMYAGVDWERKNGALVVEVFRRIHREIPTATLDVVGQHPRLDVEGVSTHGWLSMDNPAERAKMVDLYRRATAYVMPSVHEPSATVHVEAATAGIASIGSANGGVATLIGDTGFIVDPGKPEELYEAMRALSQPEFAAEMGARALARASLFTWRKTAERLLRALEIPGLDTTGLAEFL